MNFRKNISMMLAFCLLFIFCIPAYASDFNNDDTFVDLDIQNKMLRILSLSLDNKSLTISIFSFSIARYNAVLSKK